MDDIDAVSRHFHYAEPNAVFRNLGNGQFEDVSATAGADFTRAAPLPRAGVWRSGQRRPHRSGGDRAARPAQVFHNVSENHNHWLLLQTRRAQRATGWESGRRSASPLSDGQTQYNEVTTSTGYAASSDPRVHFGLGDSSARIREIEIRWPSGMRQELRDLKADHVLTMVEPRQVPVSGEVTELYCEAGLL